MILTKESRTPRHTAQRRMVLGALKTMPGTSTADEVWQRVRRALPGIGLATVYRNLKALKARGEIVEVASPVEQRFAGFAVRRGEFRCQRCDAVTERPVGGFPTDGIAPTGSRVLGLTVTVSGICPRCAAELAA